MFSQKSFLANQTTDAVPNPGLNICQGLSFLPFIWRITLNESLYRQHYAILPAVKTISTERSTGWHLCHLGDNPKDGAFYLEHYLALEDRPELSLHNVKKVDKNARTCYVVTIRPGFTWPDHYALSPPGYRAHGLYHSMGSGHGPIIARDGVHGQAIPPGGFNRPDSPQHRLGNGVYVVQEEKKPDYGLLARNAPYLSPIWNRWVQYQSDASHYARLNMNTLHPQIPFKNNGDRSCQWSQNPLRYQSGNQTRIPGPFMPMSQCAGPASQQHPYPSNNIDIHSTDNLQVKLNYSSSHGADAAASEVRFHR